MGMAMTMGMTISTGLDLALDWVKSQDLSERVIVGPSDLSRLRNPLLSPLYGAPTVRNRKPCRYRLESMLYEWYVFMSMNQGDGEPIDMFVKRLKTQTNK